MVGPSHPGRKLQKLPRKFAGDLYGLSIVRYQLVKLNGKNPVGQTGKPFRIGCQPQRDKTLAFAILQTPEAPRTSPLLGRGLKGILSGCSTCCQSREPFMTRQTSVRNSKASFPTKLAKARFDSSDTSEMNTGVLPYHWTNGRLSKGG